MTSPTLSELIEKTIAGFDAANADFDSVKKNILWYASINVAHGRLRPEAPPIPPSTNGGSIDPFAAEEEDRQRQMHAAPPPAAAVDPLAVAGLLSLNEQGRFWPFDVEKNLNNQIRAICAITGCLPTAANFKQCYIGSLNLIQNTSIPYAEEVIVSFDNPVLLEDLWREGLITRSSVHLFAPHEQQQIAHRIADAFALIKAVDETLHDAILSMIGTIACVRREGSSGTVSSMIGLLWLNPDPGWTIMDFAENIVHEYIHNTIFLTDLVEKIFTTPHWYAPEDSLVTSAIKKYPRGVNISFHSVFVAIGLIIFMAKGKQRARAEELTSGLRETMAGLIEKSERFLSPCGIHMLQSTNIYDLSSA